MQQLRIKFISGSLRKGSFNTRLAHYAAAVAAELGLESEVLALNAFPMPLLNQDDEAEFGAPEAAVALKGKLLQSDCLVLVCPEYNGSITAALKNAIDWLSRPATQPAGNVFAGKWVALMAASPGALGGLRGLTPVRELMFNLGALVLPEQLALAKAHEAFTEDGSLLGDYQQSKVKSILLGLIAQQSKG
ncbi:NAD(P)H-dependent oxidoreductase [Shewanella algae]|uniref:NADPH-dependent FMN reductase n=1 Tax=Shewanella algae TaxID=38313 RepID=UPI0031F5709C